MVQFPLGTTSRGIH